MSGDLILIHTDVGDLAWLLPHLCPYGPLFQEEENGTVLSASGAMDAAMRGSWSAMRREGRKEGTGVKVRGQALLPG